MLSVLLCVSGQNRMRMSKVSFAGITKEVCLAYVPEAEVGDYVIVHVGFAISIVDEEEAGKVFEYLREMDELGELDIPQPAPRAGPEPQGSAS